MQDLGQIYCIVSSLHIVPCYTGSYYIDPCCICFAATKADGTVFTGYYNADATDKAVFAHNIQSDIVMDIIKANADTISGILEDGK